PRRCARKISEGGVATIAIEKVMCAARVVVGPDDLTEIVDGPCLGERGRGNVNRGVDARAVEIPVCRPAGIPIRSDNLTRGVDAIGSGEANGVPGEVNDARGQRVVENDIAIGGNHSILYLRWRFATTPHSHGEKYGYAGCAAFA